MVKLHGAVLPKLTDFPSSPSEGRLAFVNDALFVYTTVDGLDSWYPMTNRTKRYIHGQPTSATNWVISHNLGTQQLLVICYDASGNLITPSNITYDSDNQITVTHSVSRTGDCAIFIDMAEQLSVSTGVIDKIEEGNSSLEVTDTGTGQIQGTTDGNDVFNLTDTLQRIGKDVGVKIELDQTGSVTLDGTPIELYHNGAKKLETQVNGITITGSFGDLDIITDSNGVYFSNETVSSNVVVRGKKASGSRVNVVHGDPDGQTDIYYNGQSNLRVLDHGIEIADPAYDGQDEWWLRWNNGVPYERIRSSGEPYTFSMDNSSNQDTTVMTADPDSEVALYNNGDLAIRTTVQGLGVYSTPSNDAPAVNLYESDGTKIFRIHTESDSFNAFRVRDAADANWDDSIRMNREGSVELYNNNIKTFETFINAGANEAGLRILSEDNTYGGHLVADDDDNSIKLFGGLSQNTMHLHATENAGIRFYHNGTQIVDVTAQGIYYKDGTDQGSLQLWSGSSYWTGETNSHQMVIRSKDSVGGLKNGIVFNPDAGVKAYYDGNEALDIKSGGVRVMRQGTTKGFDMVYSGIDMAFTNREHGGDFNVYCEDAAGTSRSIFHGNPDSASIMYYNGAAQIETYASGGARMRSTNGTHVLNVYPDTSGNSYIYPTSAGTNTYLYNLNVSSSARYLTHDPDAPGFYPNLHNAIHLGLSNRAWHTVYASTGTIQSSDERKKENIVSSDLGLDFINDLNPVSFKFKDYDYEEIEPINGEVETGTLTHLRTHYGLISQEVLSTLTSHGKTSEQFGGYVRDESTDYYGLRYDEFIAPIIKAAQELSTICDNQQTTIDAQQTVIDDLVARVEALEA